MANPQNTQPNPACPQCSSKFTVKKGRRQNRFRILQVFQCRECLYKFTAAAGKNKTYPPRAILETVSTYNLGNSISDTQRAIRKRLHVDIPEGTIRSWIRAPVEAIRDNKIVVSVTTAASAGAVSLSVRASSRMGTS